MTKQRAGLKAGFNFFSAAFIAVVLILPGCKSSEQRKKEAHDSNPIREYVQTPKDKAKAAKEAVEEKQDEERRQFDELSDN